MSLARPGARLWSSNELVHGSLTPAYESGPTTLRGDLFNDCQARIFAPPTTTLLEVCMANLGMDDDMDKEVGDHRMCQ